MSLCGTDKRTNEQLKIELLSQWKLEAEFRKIRSHFFSRFFEIETLVNDWFQPHIYITGKPTFQMGRGDEVAAGGCLASCKSETATRRR